MSTFNKHPLNEYYQANLKHTNFREEVSRGNYPNIQITWGVFKTYRFWDPILDFPNKGLS